MSGFPAYLYLENGELYSGIGFGIKKHETAEVVFNTALSGYQEIITDPSYAKQIITFTNPHIGNTGINEEDNEASSIYASGIVIRPNNNPACINRASFIIFFVDTCITNVRICKSDYLLCI